MSQDNYAGREQTLVKHIILEHYLERFAHIVGYYWDAITYIDCFSGPWNVRSNNLDDSSFSIAVKQLKSARHNLADKRLQRGKHDLALRCFFLERDHQKYQRLSDFASQQADIEIVTKNKALEHSIDEIVEFVHARRDTFTFIFVDPTGWGGFGMDVIGPLLKLDNCEVLINFMTGYIVRFAEHRKKNVRASFDRLFGDVDFRRRIAGKQGLEREEELVRAYCDAVRTAGGFDYVCPAIVLQPEKNRTHFHLLYATRNSKGVEEFKKAEKQAMAQMELKRGEARQRKRHLQTGQRELFSAEDMHDPGYYDDLRQRHCQAVMNEVRTALSSGSRVRYGILWEKTLLHPLVWESDLSRWIKDWEKAGQVRIEGLASPRHKLRREAEHYVVGHLREDSR